MGAAILIPILLIVLVAIGYVLWTVFAAGRGAAAAAKSVGGHTTGETAAHSDEHTAIRSVEHTAPPGAAENLRDEGAREWSPERQVNEQGMAENQPDHNRRSDT